MQGLYKFYGNGKLDISFYTNVGSHPLQKHFLLFYGICLVSTVNSLNSIYLIPLHFLYSNTYVPIYIAPNTITPSGCGVVTNTTNSHHITTPKNEKLTPTKDQQ